jgi:chromatin remodeling complex protein RSC6
MATAKSTAKAAPKKKTTSALDKPVNISDALAAVIGPGPLPRTKVTQKLWDYIKKHNLQHPVKKRLIKPDDKLSKVLGKEEIDMLKLPGKVSKHLTAV